VTGADDFEQQTYRKVDLRIVPFLFLCYILAYLDRVNVGFFFIPESLRIRVGCLNGGF
jgi:hypothetical protein